MENFRQKQTPIHDTFKKKKLLSNYEWKNLHPSACCCVQLMSLEGLLFFMKMDGEAVDLGEKRGGGEERLGGVEGGEDVVRIIAWEKNK